MNHQWADLQEGLRFLHVSELRDICVKLGLQDGGKKEMLIQRILHFVETGDALNTPQTPVISCAKRGVAYPLQPETLILKGAYKNDLSTRLFFKELIGDYFHFTAFGIDWLNDRWMAGKPATYQEFADMWKAEYARRQSTPKAPKAEWAYINFTQRFLRANPNAARTDLLAAWARERHQQRDKVEKILAGFK